MTPRSSWGLWVLAFVLVLAVHPIPARGNGGPVPCGDLDADGLRTALDLSRLRQALANPERAGLSPDEMARCPMTDASDECDVLQMVLLWRATLDPPLPPAPREVCEGGDGDGDGVSNSDDGCPEDPFDEGSLYGGCGPVGSRANGRILASAADRELARAGALLPGLPDTGSLADQLSVARAALARVVERAARDTACRGLVTEAEAAVSEFDEALLLADRALASYERPAPADDTTPEDNEELQLSLARARIEQAAGVAHGLAEAYSRSCAQEQSVRDVDVIEQIDDARREVVTRGGKRYWMVEDAVLTGQVTEGTRVSIEGSDFLASSLLRSISGPLLDAFPDDPECLFLRFAPIQPPPGPAPRVLHDPEGYRAPTGTYLFEQGMGLAAESVNCPRAEPGLSFRRQHLRVSVDYTTTQGVPVTQTIAQQLDEHDAPIRLPADLDRSELATLTVWTNVQSCTIQLQLGGFTLSCEAEGAIAARSYELRVRERGARCVASYADTFFDVDDRDSGDFREAVVTGKTVIAGWDAGTEPEFRAEGYPICSGAVCPNVGVISEGQPFAIRNTDFVSIYPNTSALVDLWQRAFSGVDHAAGLRWPHVVGVNNGRPWRFSCTLPRVVRDVVDFCPGEPADAFFRLPFAKDSAVWGVAQGNLSAPGCTGADCPSHANAYAIDMGRGQCGEEIRAPRAAIVVQTRDGGTCQNGSGCSTNPDEPICESLCCTPTSPVPRGNAIWLLHQDGSYTTYSHLKPNGIAVEEGDFVRRGQLLGLMGTTGNSGGVHLHWETKRGESIDELKSELGLFRNRAADGSILPCEEPEPGDELRSDNPPWP